MVARGDRARTGEETLEDEPSAVAFVGAAIALVGTKGGRIHRYAIE